MRKNTTETSRVQENIAVKFFAFILVLFVISVGAAFAAAGTPEGDLRLADKDYQACLNSLPPKVRSALTTPSLRANISRSGAMQKKVGACLVKERARDDAEDVIRLSRDLAGLSGKDINKEVSSEAEALARTLVTATKKLNDEYRMGRVALWHNFLIKLGMKKGGYCYQWAERLLAALPREKLGYFERHWGVHNLKGATENNAIIITRRGSGISEGIVYDPWRGKGSPYWVLVSKDSQDWSELFTENQILAGRF